MCAALWRCSGGASRVTILLLMLLLLLTMTGLTLLHLPGYWNPGKTNENNSVQYKFWKQSQSLLLCYFVLLSPCPTLGLLSLGLGNTLCFSYKWELFPLELAPKPSHCHGSLLDQAKLIFSVLIHQWYLVLRNLDVAKDRAQKQVPLSMDELTHKGVQH